MPERSPEELKRLEVVEIFNAKGRTRHLARKYNVSTKTIAQIKGARGLFAPIIEDYLHKTQIFLAKGRFGYDPHYRVFSKIWRKSA